jgi:hypothetical protein
VNYGTETRLKHTYIQTVVCREITTNMAIYGISEVISDKFNVHRICTYTAKYSHNSNGATDVLDGKVAPELCSNPCHFNAQKGIQICTFVETHYTKCRIEYLEIPLLLSETG